MSASFPCQSNIFEKKKKYPKLLKAILSRLLSSKFEKSFIQPFIRCYSHFLPMSGTEDLPWPMDYNWRDAARDFPFLPRLYPKLLARQFRVITIKPNSVSDNDVLYRHIALQVFGDNRLRLVFSTFFSCTEKKTCLMTLEHRRTGTFGLFWGGRREGDLLA